MGEAKRTFQAEGATFIVNLELRGITENWQQAWGRACTRQR